jgi:hypothetical protein
MGGLRHRFTFEKETGYSECPMMLLFLPWTRARLLLAHHALACFALSVIACAILFYVLPFAFFVARFLGWPWQQPARSRYWWRGDC